MKSDGIIKILAKRRSFTLKVEGASMLPLLLPGDILSLEKTSFLRIKEDDIALVIKNNQPLIHRVIYKSDKYLVTRGDNKIKSDGTIKPSQVYSKVTGLKRGRQSIQLEDYYLYQSSRYFEAIYQLAVKLAEKKIKYVILKGLPLHLYYEKTHPKRIYADCDFLINPKDFGKVDRILLDLGYRMHDTSISPAGKWFGILPKEFVYFSKDKILPVIFDVHTEVLFLMNQLGVMDAFYPKALQRELNKDFLNSIKLIEIAGRKMPILEQTHLALYLALHFFHHSFQGINRLKLIYKVFNNYADPVNIDELKKLIKLYNLENFVLPVFFILRNYWPLSPEKDFQKKIKFHGLFGELVAKEIFSINIFDDDTRWSGGIKRLKYTFLFSSSPIMKKISFFLTPYVLLTAIWLTIHKARRKIVQFYKIYKTLL